MRFFTDKLGNFNWGAVGGICAAVGSVLAVATFFSSSGGNATEKNTNMVLHYEIYGDKIDGISLAQYEDGLKRREEEVLARLKNKDIPEDEVRALRDALQKIDARQTSLESSYADVSKLTADIRTYEENAENPELVLHAIAALFDGDTAQAVRLSIKAGIPVVSVGTIDSLTSVFQPIETEADFRKYVVGRDLVPSNDQFYKANIGANGSLIGYQYNITRVLFGSWAWISGKFCREYSFRSEHVAEHCAQVFATHSAVKFVDLDGTTQIFSKE